MRLFTADSLYEQNEKICPFLLHMCVQCIHSTTLGPVENVTNVLLYCYLLLFYFYIIYFEVNMKQTMNLCILNVYNRYELKIINHVHLKCEILFFCFIETQEKNMILLT